MSQRQRQWPQRTRPLPRPNPFNTTQPGSAYQMCLHLEDCHAVVRQSEETRLSVLVCARLLGHMLIEAPTETGRQNIATEIIRSVDDDQLQKLAETYKNYFILCCKSIVLCLHNLPPSLSTQFVLKRVVHHLPVRQHRLTLRWKSTSDLRRRTPIVMQRLKLRYVLLLNVFAQKYFPDPLD